MFSDKSLDKIIELCRSSDQERDYYIKLRDYVYKLFDTLSEDEQEALSDALEELEMTIEWVV
jgi:hypothetical protein